MSAQLKPNQALTGKVRFASLSVFEARASEINATPKFFARILIDKKDVKNIKIIEDASKAAHANGVEKTFKGAKVKWESPLHDGDEHENTNYKGCFYLNASAGADRKPFVSGPDGLELMNRTDLYSGCYGRIMVDFYPYNNVSKGVGCGLLGIKLLHDGEALGGSNPAAAVFGAIEEDDEI